MGSRLDPAPDDQKRTDVTAGQERPQESVAVVTPVLPQKIVTRPVELFSLFCYENGGEGRNRTVDTTIFSQRTPVFPETR